MEFGARLDTSFVIDVILALTKVVDGFNKPHWCFSHIFVNSVNTK
jgi:hypothetical protein